MKEEDVKEKMFPLCNDCGMRHDPTQPSYKCLDAEGKAAFHLILDTLEKDPEIGKRINDIRRNIDRL